MLASGPPVSLPGSRRVRGSPPPCQASAPARCAARGDGSSYWRGPSSSSSQTGTPARPGANAWNRNDSACNSCPRPSEASRPRTKSSSRPAGSQRARRPGTRRTGPPTSRSSRGSLPRMQRPSSPGPGKPAPCQGCPPSRTLPRRRPAERLSLAAWPGAPGPWCRRARRRSAASIGASASSGATSGCAATSAS